MIKTNIIITGLLRNTDMLLKSLIDYKQLQNDGLVDKIIFSTWNGVFDKNKKLRKKIKELGLYLIEAEQPRRTIGNVWHQMKSLHLGLQVVEEGSYIFKTRSDLYISPNFLRKLITDREYLEINSSIKNNKIFSKKVWIPWFEISKPFYMADECFFGLERDLRLLVNFDAAYHLLYNIGTGITHIRRFIHPFVDEYPILKEYLHIASRCSGHFKSNRFEILNYSLLSDIYLEYLAVYYMILTTYFRVESNYKSSQIMFREWSESSVVLEKNQFTANFSEGKVCIPGGYHIFAYDEKWLNNLLNRQIHDGEAVERFYQALSRVENNIQNNPERHKMADEYFSQLNKIYIEPPQPSVIKSRVKKLLRKIARY